MSQKIQRRSFLKAAVIGAVAAPVVTQVAQAGQAALPLVDPNDAGAKALGYIHDAAKVDAKANPTFKPNQKCANCIQYTGKVSDAQAGCNLFPGKGVKGAGWCKVWVQKPCAYKYTHHWIAGAGLPRMPAPRRSSSVGRARHS